MNFSAAEIFLVISNITDVQGLRRAENAGIATKVGCFHGNNLSNFNILEIQWISALQR